MRRMVRYRRLLVVEIIITQRITQALTATVPHRVFSAKPNRRANLDGSEYQIATLSLTSWAWMHHTSRQDIDLAICFKTLEM